MYSRRDAFQAIVDPTRRAILLLLASQAMTAGQLADKFDTSRPTIAKHLQILGECRLLEKEKNGREVVYTLNPQKMKEVTDYIEELRKVWDDRFNKLESIMKNRKDGK
jgi:DNA-binding transcriptional ArsR family regulator